MTTSIRTAVAAALLAAPALADGWALASNMSGPHDVDQASTGLLDGRFLVVGGLGEGDSTVATAEVYDPVSASWSMTPPMSVPRSGHTATLLASGRVLVAGGYDQMPCYPSCGVPVHDTAEVYDPATSSWTPTGDLMGARGGHTATLLPSGKVLLAGGFDSAVALATAEIYDPATGTFTPTGAMLSARYAHTATLLANGRVLVAGGFPSNDAPPYHALASAEVYDPQSGTWTATGSMHTGRMWHESLALDKLARWHTTTRLKASGIGC
ncbi:MAG: kelch repeat-containing protein [Planctomycetota bacterium]